MLKIVLIEDNDNLRAALVSALTAEGNIVIGLDCAEALAEQKDGVDIDILVVDLNLPGEDGMSLAKRMRATQPDLGIIVITARDAPDMRRISYESGADIYLAKPVKRDEVSAAIQALTRRMKLRATELPPFSMKVRQAMLLGPAGEVRLVDSEIALLGGLVRARGQVLETWQVLELLTKQPGHPNRNAVNVSIFRVNEKLSRVGAPQRSVRAVRNFGYRLHLDLQIC